MIFHHENCLPVARMACALWLLCAFSLPLFAQRPVTNQTLPNIVIILADDLGWGDLSCYGQKKFSTPNLDRLAAEGMRFTQAYAGSPSGAASRGTLFTGKHTGHARIRSNYGPDGHPVALRGEDTTVTDVLKRAGYHTGVIGKWGLGGDGTSGMPEKKGVDQSLGLLELRQATNQFPAVVARYDPKQVIFTNAVSYYQPIFENEGGRQVRHARQLVVGCNSQLRQSSAGCIRRRVASSRLHLRGSEGVNRVALDPDCDQHSFRLASCAKSGLGSSIHRDSDARRVLPWIDPAGDAKSLRHDARALCLELVHGSGTSHGSERDIGPFP